MNDIPKELIASEFVVPDTEVFWEFMKSTYIYLGLQLFLVCVICVIIFLVMSVVSGIRYYIDKKKYGSDIYQEDFLWNIGYLVYSVVGVLVLGIGLPLLA